MSPRAVARAAGRWRGAPDATPRAVARLAKLAQRLAFAAWRDPASGLANRRHAASEIDRGLHVRGTAVVGVRVLGGGDAACGSRLDARLQAVAEVLGAYPPRVAGAFVFRLAAQDLALCLPVPRVAEETARTLLPTLRSAADEPGIVLAAIDSAPGTAGGPLLAAAMLALDRAQAAGRFAIEVVAQPGDADAGPDERSWREQAEQALAEGRVRLASRALQAAGGALRGASICTPLVCVGRRPEADIGRLCLSTATRRRLQPVLDLAALRLALAAAAQDEVLHGVPVGAASLALAGFRDEAAALFGAQPASAARLRLSVRGAASVAALRPCVQAAAGAWHGLGVSLAIETDVLEVGHWPLLADLGVSQVTVDGAFLRDLTRDGALADAARGLATLAHALGWQLVVDGVEGTAATTMLHALGTDGVVAPS